MEEWEEDLTIQDKTGTTTRRRKRRGSFNEVGTKTGIRSEGNNLFLQSPPKTVKKKQRMSASGADVNKEGEGVEWSLQLRLRF